MNREPGRIPRYVVLLSVGVIALICLMVYIRQRSDMDTLQRTLQNVRSRELILQNEVSEKQRELNISNSTDYIAGRARENGYMMPGEIRFIVSNPEALLSSDTAGSAVVEAVETVPAEEPAPDIPAPEGAEQADGPQDQPAEDQSAVQEEMP